MRLIDADKLQMRIADLQLIAAPDERDSEEVQEECRKAVKDLETFSELVDEQPTVYFEPVPLEKALEDDGK
ncbi:MAG: hypothetical protein Q4B26_19150 [Eubacteriales bacterium]|nr:hypothetical protein [Eubacteriales bacterium]